MINFLIYLFNNIHLIVPSIEQIIGIIGLVIFLFTSITIGSLVTKKSNLSANFFIGYSVNYIFCLFLFLLKINLNYSFFSLIIITVIYFFKDIGLYFETFKKKFNQNKLKIILFLPLFIILISSDAIGWDTFTHWLPLADGLKSLDHYPSQGHGEYYPFASSIVLSNSSIFIDNISENVSAIFSLFLLILFIQNLENIYKDIFNIRQKNTFTFFIILFVIYNPIHMNKFIFTAYSDFISGALFFFIFCEMYKYFNKINNLNIISLSLMASLMIGLKNTGLILVLILFITFLVYLFFEKNLNKKNFYSLLLFLMIPFLIYMFWYLTLKINSVFVDNFFKFPLFKEENIIFFKSAWSQILTRPTFFITSIFIILMIPISSFFKNEKFKLIYNLSFLYGIVFFLWISFVISTYIFHFDINLFYANSFWRYCSQISLLCTFIFGFYIVYLLEKIKLFNFKIIGMIFLILILINPIIFSYKLRRDIDPISLEIKKFRKYENQFEKVFLAVKNNAYETVRLNYYLQKPYSNDIVESLNVENISITEFKDKTLENKYQLYIYLKKDNNNKLTKQIYLK